MRDLVLAAFLQSESPGFLMIRVLSLAFLVLFVASGWRLFTKAGEPGWAVLIPIWNAIVLVKVAGKPWWWILLLFVPIVWFIAYWVILVGLASNFGKGAGFAAGLYFLPFVFVPMLAWGDAKYDPEGKEAFANAAGSGGLSIR
jgi:hypothetical protein